MTGINDQQRLEEVRKRLYERGAPKTSSITHPLAGDVPREVHTQWQTPPKPIVLPEPVVQTMSAESTSSFAQDMGIVKRKKGYRTKILLTGLGFFMLAVVLSSLFLMFGNKTISGENITLSATGPFTVGGGGELQLQVGVTNDNTVPIESATLIVKYPKGTQSSTEPGKELFTERLPLQTIKQGETVNIPLRALVFGEENEEKIVEVEIEYRVQGSNATFFKEAEPLRFKISSSPVLVRADALKKISSGQETEVTLTITSNSPTPLSEILVKAEYPGGFDFSKANIAPTNGENMWLVKNLEPGKETKIIITGVVVGKETDKYAINFTVGVPNERDPQSLASVFATSQTQFEIEQPFLDIAMKVNNSDKSEVAIEPGKRASVQLELKNTLEDALYDIVIEVKLSGNAYSIHEVSPTGGYFDPSKNTIVWDVSNTPALSQATPGETERLSFSIEAASGVSVTPQVNISVNAKARRVSENQVAEQLTGTAASSLRVISTPNLVGVVSHNNGIFPDTGPVPPVSDKATTYTVSLVVQNGSNSVANAVVSASLPAYVTWLNKVEGNGTVTYNPTTRAIEWKAGSIEANKETFTSFQVSLLPRSLQIGTTPTLISEQRIEATDRFTTTIVRDTSPAITTKIPSESGNDDVSGVVRAKE